MGKLIIQDREVPLAGVSEFRLTTEHGTIHLRPRIGDAVSWSDVGGAGRPTVNTARVVSLCSESGGLFVAFKHDGASYLWTLEQWQLDNGNTTWIPNNDSIFR